MFCVILHNFDENSHKKMLILSLVLRAHQVSGLIHTCGVHSSEITYIVSSGALNCTHSLTHPSCTALGKQLTYTSSLAK